MTQCNYAVHLMETLHLSDSSEGESEGSYIESLTILKNAIKDVDALFTKCQEHYKVFHQKVSLPLDEALLEPRPSTIEWLQKRKLPLKLTFADFFAKMLEEHRDMRLDISTRSIIVNADAAKLFGVPTDTHVSILTILQKLPILFL